MERILACPGSVKLSQGVAREVSKEADEGTAAHHLAAQAVLSGRVDCEDAETRRSVGMYFEEVERIRNEYTIMEEGIEETLESGDVPGLGGTPDYFAVYMDGDKVVLHIVDYKHGIGVPVPAVGNLQLLSYCLIVSSVVRTPIDLYRMTIVQPRLRDHCGISTWETTSDRVEEHARAILDAIGKDDLSVGAHCRWCPAITRCPAVQGKVARTQGQVADEDLSEMMRALPALRAFISTLEDRVLGVLRSGGDVPGFKVVQGLGNRRWKFEEERILRYLSRAKISRKVAIKRTLLSPAQLEKVVDKQIIEKLTERIPSGYRVVPVSAPGETVSFNGSEFE
jgi:hypothetical protein